METVGIEQARHRLGEIVDRIRYTGQPTAITRQGKPAVVVVGAAWYAAALKTIAGRGVYSRHEVVHLDGDPANNDPANLELREKQS